MHEKILGIEEDIWQALNIPYHVINIAAGDLGVRLPKNMISNTGHQLIKNTAKSPAAPTAPTTKRAV